MPPKTSVYEGVETKNLDSHIHHRQKGPSFYIAALMPKAKFAQVVKFVFYKKATKCCKISTLLLSVCTVDKSKGGDFAKFCGFLRIYELYFL